MNIRETRAARLKSQVHEKRSLASSLASLPEETRKALLKGYSDDQLRALIHDWQFWARPEQLAPETEWRIWIQLGGRGSGKTRSGAEWANSRAMAQVCHGMLVSKTPADARDDMIEGESGVLKVSHPSKRPKYEPSKRLLTWPNGSTARVRSGADPEGLRGANTNWVWADELAAWDYPRECWDQLSFTCRVGENPQILVTTTPKPIALLKELLKRPDAAVSRYITYDNIENLAPEFVAEIKARYEGTTLGQQEIYAIVLEEAEGALWTRKLLNDTRIQPGDEPSSFVRVVVAIDPAISVKQESNETGIIVAALASNGHGYVLEDLTNRYSPDQWANAAIEAYHRHGADRIIAESNQGGDMVEHTVRTVWANAPFRQTHASDGKRTRAEPVMTLYQAGKVHHVGLFEHLEDQMCLHGATLIETLRGQIPISQVTTQDSVMTREGWRDVVWAGPTGEVQRLHRLRYVHGCVLCTPCHPILLEGSFAGAASVRPGQHLSVSRSWVSTAGRLRGVAAGITECGRGTIATPRASSCTAQSMKRTTGQSVETTSTTETVTPVITGSRILSGLRRSNTIANMGPEVGMPTRQKSAASCSANHGNGGNHDHAFALCADGYSGRLASARNSVVVDVGVVSTIKPVPVYNLKVAETPEFFANGVLVHNCTWVPDQGEPSPDRMDALVWAMHELMLKPPVFHVKPGGDETASYWRGG